MSSIAHDLPDTTDRPHNGAVQPTGPCRWRRLGELVLARRVQLGYRRRPAFAEASGISIRILGDIETGRRNNFDRGTIAALEHTLRWAVGSVAAVLGGGEPTDTRAPPPDTATCDEALIRVMRSNLTDEQKRRVARLLIAEKEAAERLRVAHADEMIRLARGE